MLNIDPQKMSPAYMDIYKKAGILTEDLEYENLAIKSIFDKIYDYENNKIDWNSLKFFCELYEIKDIDIAVEIITHIKNSSNNYISARRQKDKENEVNNTDNKSYKAYSKVRY